MPLSLHIEESYQGLPPAELSALVTAQQAADLASDLVLRADATGLSLTDAAEPKAAPTRIDFLDAALQYRLRTSGKRQGLAKAVGLDKLTADQQLFVVDATAGLGRDALVLAHLGCRVLMLERSPVMHALLADGLMRAQAAADTDFKVVLDRLQLLPMEARDWCATAGTTQPDVICLDPMFPPRDKSARVKKDIALLHQLLGSEEELGTLLEAALQSARYRVVLKRPDGKVPDALLQPTLWVGERPAAFAVYVNSSFSRMR